MANIKSDRPCRFNSGVGCTYQECSRCGFNPKVKRYRVAKWRSEQIAKNKYWRYTAPSEKGERK